MSTLPLEWTLGSQTKLKDMENKDRCLAEEKARYKRMSNWSSFPLRGHEVKPMVQMSAFSKFSRLFSATSGHITGTTTPQVSKHAASAQNTFLSVAKHLELKGPYLSVPT